MPRNFLAGKLLPLPIPQQPWSHLALDLIIDLPVSNGNTVILNRFSRSLWLVPIPSLLTTFQLAEIMSDWVFRYFCLPEDTVSDRGPQFISQVWNNFLEKLGATVSFTSSYHPQANEQVERVNQEMWRFLRSFCSENQSNWAHFLPWAEYAQNSLRHSTT